MEKEKYLIRSKENCIEVLNMKYMCKKDFNKSLEFLMNLKDSRRELFIGFISVEESIETYNELVLLYDDFMDLMTTSFLDKVERLNKENFDLDFYIITEGGRIKRNGNLNPYTELEERYKRITQKD